MGFTRDATKKYSYKIKFESNDDNKRLGKAPFLAEIISTDKYVNPWPCFTTPKEKTLWSLINNNICDMYKTSFTHHIYRLIIYTFKARLVQ